VRRVVQNSVRHAPNTCESPRTLDLRSVVRLEEAWPMGSRLTEVERSTPAMRDATPALCLLAAFCVGSSCESEQKFAKCEL